VVTSAHDKVRKRSRPRCRCRISR